MPVVRGNVLNTEHQEEPHRECQFEQSPEGGEGVSHDTICQEISWAEGRAGAKVLRQERAWSIQRAEKHARTREKGRGGR